MNESLNEYLTDRLLANSIEAHKRIVTEGESVDLASLSYEEGTPFDRVHQHNAFTILSKLDFPKDEVLNVSSESTKHLDDLAATDRPTEEIIQSLLKYRDEIK
ncbi:hypothetical protein ACFOUV_02555 [Oceanobacillus longus]|uniref:Uncharacterized protein n=1 Tax=Oceanobacillus longus TaxID=930120 RepID=A0ABV8GVK3_9BACI